MEFTACMPRGIFAFAALGLAVASAAPASATPADTLLVPPRANPKLDEQGPFNRTFWDRLRRDALAFRALNGDTFGYARRYRISGELAQTIAESARAEGIDPELGFRLVHTESRFKPRARGRFGALGLVQLMPGTARGIDRSLRTEEQILDPENNLRVGFRYLRRLIGMYDGNVRLALLAYNRGENTVSRLLRRGQDPENGYSRRVLRPRGGEAYTGPGTVPGNRGAVR